MSPDILVMECIRCGTRDHLQLTWNRPHGGWICRSCLSVERHRDALTEYHAEEYDEPLLQPRDETYRMPSGYRGRRVA